MIPLIILIIGLVVIVKIAMVLSLETVIAIVGLLIVLPIIIKLFNVLDQLTFKGYVKLSAICAGLYGLSWCWQALPS